MEIAHHIFGALFGIWLVYTLRERKEEFSFNFAILILICTIVVAVTLTLSFEKRHHIENLLTAILTVYWKPVVFVFLSVFVLYFVQREWPNLFPFAVPRGQLFYLAFITMGWILAVEIVKLLRENQ